MLKNDLQKPLTLEDLGKFTEEVLLPAIEEMIDRRLEVKLEEKFEEKLSPIWQELRSIGQRLDRLEEKVNRMDKASSEDLFAINTEVEKLKKRVAKIESHAHVLQSN
ncbi:MAG: hypothetical protein Q7T79_03145 [bacterium]|nr:hypothetical protein [bacterium]